MKTKNKKNHFFLPCSVFRLSLHAVQSFSVIRSEMYAGNLSSISNATVDSTASDVFAKISNYYDYLYDYADPRMRDRFLMGKPHWIIIIYAIYVLVITHVLPSFMRNRKPYDFQKVSLYIDAVLWLIAGYFLTISLYAWIFLYDWQCQPIDMTNSWNGLASVEICWQFLITRFVYMFHSLPFVLSKRKSSLADYLLVHHATFPLMVWSFVNYYPGGHVAFGGFINSLTHVGLIGMKFVILYLPEVKHFRRPVHFWLHVSTQL